MRIHAVRDVNASAWRHAGSPQHVQLRIGVMRFSATPAEARQFAAALVAAADAVESAQGGDYG